MLRPITILVLLSVAVFGCRHSESNPAKEVALYTKPLLPSANSNLVEPTLAPLTAISVGEPSAIHWPQFRGAAMLASSPFATVPITWNSDRDIVWKAEVIEGVKSRGASSPIVLGNRVFLTAFSGCGTTNQDRENLSELKHHVLCFDKHTGKQIWERTIQGSYAHQRLSDHALGHGFASSTPITDGQRLYAFFGVSGVFAFDLDGNLLWQANVGTGNEDFGSSASLAVFENLLMVNASAENQTLYALETTTGHAVWKRDNFIQSWSTPVLAKTLTGADELILNQKDVILGLNPRTGEELWRCKGIDDYVVATPIVVDGVCFVTGGQQHQTMAIKIGGSGDVTDTHKLWQIRKGSNVCSPVYHDGILYAISSNGILQFFDTETGKLVTRQRMGISEQVLASPTILGDHMFVPTQDKGVVVLNIEDDCQVVAKNSFAKDDNPLQASIAVSENSLFIRTDDHLYCVGRAFKPTALVESTDLDGPTQLLATFDSPAQREVIIPTAKYNIDEKTRRPKPWVRCLVTEPDAILAFMLTPYKSVITPEQTAKSTEFILANHQPFIELRQQYLDLTWEYMRGKKTEKEFADELAMIEELTLKQNYLVRNFIKGMFSEEQMDQHRLEAGIVRKKPKSAP